MPDEQIQSTETQVQEVPATGAEPQTEAPAAPEPQSTDSPAPSAVAKTRAEPSTVPYARFAQTTGRLRQVEGQFSALQGENKSLSERLRALEAQLESRKQDASSRSEHNEVDKMLDSLGDDPSAAKLRQMEQKLAEYDKKFGDLQSHISRAEEVRLENFYASAIPEASRQTGVSESEIVSVLKTLPSSHPYWDDPWALAEEIASSKTSLGQGWPQTAPKEELEKVLKERGFALADIPQVVEQMQQAATQQVADKLPKSPGSAPSGAVPEKPAPRDRHNTNSRVQDTLAWLQSRRR